MKHFKKLFTIVVSVLLMMSIMMHAPLAASSKTISNNTNYSVKLNGKSKTLRVETSTYYSYGYQYLSQLRIKVNGNIVYTYTPSSYYSCSVPTNKLLTMNNGKSYLWLSIGTDESDIIDKILYYNGSKFVQAVDGQCLPGCSLSQSRNLAFHIDYRNVKVYKNTLKVYYSVMFDSIGGVEFYDTLKYSKGKLVRSSKTVSSFSIYKEVNYTYKKATVFKTKTSLRAYKTAGGTKVKFTIPAGKNITFKSLWISSGKLYLKVKYGSKIGWLKLTNYTTSNTPFYNIAYAG